MTVAALSTAGFSQYIASSSNVSASQKAFQSLQQSLASGNLTAAQTAFNTYQQLNQSLTAASGSSSSNSSGSSQLSTDMAALGAAIGSGDLATAQSAFATVQGDLKATPSQAITSAESAVAQTVQWVEDLLNISSTSDNASTDTDPSTSMLDAAYNVGNVDSGASSTTTDPTTSILDSAYGAGTTGSSASSSGSSTTPNISSLPSSGNSASGASVNAYA
jgi:ribosomal protein S20